MFTADDDVVAGGCPAWLGGPPTAPATKKKRSIVPMRKFSQKKKPRQNPGDVFSAPATRRVIFTVNGKHISQSVRLQIVQYSQLHTPTLIAGLPLTAQCR